MVSNTTEPLLELVEQFATKHDRVVVVRDDYDKYLQNYNAPDIGFLEARAKDQGYVIVDETEYKDVVAKSEETIETKAERDNLQLIPRDEYNGLLSQIDHPTHEFLKEKANLLGEVVITEKDYVIW